MLEGHEAVDEGHEEVLLRTVGGGPWEHHQVPEHLGVLPWVAGELLPGAGVQVPPPKDEAPYHGDLLSPS